MKRCYFHDTVLFLTFLDLFISTAGTESCYIAFTLGYSVLYGSPFLNSCLSLS